MLNCSAYSQQDCNMGGDEKQRTTVNFTAISGCPGTGSPSSGSKDQVPWHSPGELFVSKLVNEVGAEISDG